MGGRRYHSSRLRELTRLDASEHQARQILSDLMAERYPVYAEADITVDSIDGPPDLTLEKICAALAEYFEREQAQPASRGGDEARSASP